MELAALIRVMADVIEVRDVAPGHIVFEYSRVLLQDLRYLYFIARFFDTSLLFKIFNPNLKLYSQESLFKQYILYKYKAYALERCFGS